MHAKIASLAVAEFSAVTPPARMDPFGIIPPGRRADVRFPIQTRWRCARRWKPSAASVITMNIDIGDLAQNPAVDITVPRFENMRCAAPFEAYLYGTLVFACRGDHRLTFHNVVADRLLYIHISTSLASIDHWKAM